jgi:Helix-turn-helix domain
MRDFLISRRAKITPDQAGLPAYGGNRRVARLRREEVAILAGVSIDYYTRLERGRAPCRTAFSAGPASRSARCASAP